MKSDPHLNLRLTAFISNHALYFIVLGDWSIFWKLEHLQQQQQDEREPHLCALLSSVLWRLAGCKSGAGPPGILQYGLRHAEHTLHALADTVHAFQLHADPDCVSVVSLSRVSKIDEKSTKDRLAQPSI